MPSVRPRRGERRYVYVSALRRAAAAVGDAVGSALVWTFTGGRGWRQPADLTRPKNLLVVRLDHLGDVLFARPCLEALKARHPGTQLTVLVSSAGAELLRRDPNVDEVLVWDAPWFARPGSPRPAVGFLALARELRLRAFDCALELRGDLRHHVLLWLVRIPARLGYGITGGGFLLHRALRLPVGVHEVERDLALAALTGVHKPPARFTPLPVSAAERRQALAHWKPRGTRVLVHPGAGDAAKRWPPERFADVCDALTARGSQVALLGTAAERPLAAAIEGLVRRPVANWCGRTSVSELVALVSTAHLVIGHDSGPAHLAVTQGVPTVMLWSQTNTPEEWGPWGAGVRAAVVPEPQGPRAATAVLAAARRLLAATQERRSR